LRDVHPARTVSAHRERVGARFVLSQRTGKILAEVGVLLRVIGGLWLAAAQISFVEMATGRTVVAGIASAAGGVLLIVATRWGHFGQEPVSR